MGIRKLATRKIGVVIRGVDHPSVVAAAEAEDRQSDAHWEKVLLEVDRLTEHAAVATSAAGAIQNMGNELDVERTCICLSSTLSELRGDLERLHGVIESTLREWRHDPG